MPDGFADTPGGDDLDFRPLASQPAQRKPAPQPRAAASDGIDFQPVGTPALVAQRSNERNIPIGEARRQLRAEGYDLSGYDEPGGPLSIGAPKPSPTPSQTSDEIDFRPAEKPATFESLYKTPPAASLTDRAARVGAPSPLVQSLAPKTADLTQVPRSPFTNQFEFGPPVRTEEETRRAGTIGPTPRGGAAHGTPYEGVADIGERVERALGAGAPEGSKMAELTGQPGTKENLRLFAPEELMTESEQLRHPVLTGAGQFAGGFTSPEGLTLLGLTAGAGELSGPGAQAVKRLLAAGFSGQMIYNAAQKTPAISQALRTGDSYNAQRLLTQLILETGTAGLAARGAFEEPTPATVPKGEISSKLMMDDATGRAARRMNEFEANEAARSGMGNLAEAERGIEADRQARINAPVEIPPTRGEPTVLQGRPQGPERNPLEVEAQRVREARAENERPAYTVRDLRRVVPEDPSQPPYYVLRRAPEAATQSMGVEIPGAADLVGARGRSKTVSELASRVLNEQDNSLLRRFGPDVLDDARQEVRAAAGLASSFERPGRYFSSIGQTEEMIPQRSQSSAKGIQAGGTWYGVSSARNMIEDMHPWFRDIAEGPETLSRIVQEGQGAAYDRVLERAATHIQNERESARPVIEEFAPQLHSLAEQVRDTDPELAQTMQDLAAGKTIGFRNLREYIQGKIDDAQTAARFSRAVDEAAAEARDAATAEEVAQPRDTARERESAPARQLGRGDIDFQPLPEPQPIHPQEVEDMSRALGRRVTAEELPEIRRRLEAERNVEAGLRGERRDVAGEIREQHRTKLERGEIPSGRSIVEPEVLPRPGMSEWLRNQTEGLPPGETPRIEGPRGLLERIQHHKQNVTNLEDQLREELQAGDHENAAQTKSELDEERGFLQDALRGVQTQEPEGVLPGMGAAVREQREAAATEQGRQLTEQANRPPESIEDSAGRMERESPLFRGKGPQGELYSGFHPRALVEGARVLQRAWDEKIAQPLIDKVLKIGDKYKQARETDPAVAEGLHLLDNAPQYLRAKAAQEVHNIIGNLSRAQERLFTLLADADSRENLRANHPEEYRQAMNDRAIQQALGRYRPIEQEMTKLRGQMGGEVLDQDYLRRIYEKHVAGVNKPEAPNTSGERATSAYDRVIRPQRIGNLSREATAEYHYERGLHEFGPAFATKFIGTHLRALRDQVAHEFIDKATMLPAGASEPRFIMYNGERYYRPDLAREMRDAGQKNVKAYDRYDPTAGEKFPVPADGKYLGPRELVKTLNDFGRREESGPGAIRRFFQEQILGFGFGVPHIANIMRRVSQSVPGGAANPKGWVESWRVVLSKELRERGISGLNDPTFDMLAKHGAISTGEMANLKEYWGGNLNPANWARSLARIGHEVLFNPEAAKGFGGLDQRARLYIADLVQSQRPELTDAQVAAAVRTQLGDYNRANWTDRQKMLGKFMMFPGWDFSSVKWVLQHPVKTTVPPALVVFLANQALNQLGQNRSEDKYDISNIHVGDRSYGTSLVRESVARNLFRPAIAYAQAKLRGENDQRAMAGAARGVTSGAGGLLSMLRPDLSGFLALATNRQGLFSSKEIVGKDDSAQPGRVLPSRAIEKQAVFALRHAVPALDRMLDSNEEIDLRSFAGGNLGVPNYRDDAEKRLLRNAAEAEEVHRTIGKLAKSNPDLAREYVKDPDNAAFALFYHDLNGLTATLKRMDEAKERIEASGLSADEKKSRTATIDKARESLLQHADGLTNLLFERREKGKPPSAFLGSLMRAARSQSQPGAQP
jgi:hypothetical protein